MAGGFWLLAFFLIQPSEMANKRKILIIAGEPSGDRHAADLVRELKSGAPGLDIYGIGGDGMAAEGVRLFYHISQMAFLGLWEVVRHIPFIRRVTAELKKWMKSQKPQAIILVDYPGFNLRLAQIAHRLGIPVIYYICPQLWAWGERRVEKIRRYVDLPLVIFKFEEEFYARRGISAVFVGHPLLDEINISINESQFREAHGLDKNKRIVALLPGSRLNEVQSLLPAMLQAVRSCSYGDDVEWVIGKAQTISMETYHRFLADLPSVRIVENDTHHLIKYAFAAVVASGTATLETGYLNTPMVVLYKVAPLTYAIGKRLVRIKNIALANIVSNKTVVPELIQHDVTARNICRELERYFTDRNHYQQTMDDLKKIRDILGTPGAAAHAAREITRFLAFG